MCLNSDNHHDHAHAEHEHPHDHSHEPSDDHTHGHQRGDHAHEEHAHEEHAHEEHAHDEHGHDHGHHHGDHEHGHGKHGHRHGDHHAHAGHAPHEAADAASATTHNSGHTGRLTLTVRAVSGLSGDMMLAGLARMLGAHEQLSDEALQGELDTLTDALGLPALHGCLRLERRSVREVAGWGCRVELPVEHAHRNLGAIREIVGQSALRPAAARLALDAFSLLAGAEARVHGKAVEEVHFHEVGALDSILDFCLAAALFERVGPEHFVCGPLPMGEGGVVCAHGWLPTPAPAVLELLEGVTVCGFSGKGETVTPTALALLKAFGAEFGPWPSMRIQARALVYGSKVFADAPNGAIWALGPEHA